MTPTFDSLLKTIKEGLRKPRNVLGKRHMQGSTGMARDRQNLLAKSNRATPNYPHKLKDLKCKQSGQYLLTSVEVNQIKELYNITDLEQRKSRMLGNTGITFFIDNNEYYIKK
tara:strand:+ start:207 stop:545 length:339 start_codon:yes stop_codon:yes gene_type:complete